MTFIPHTRPGSRFSILVSFSLEETVVSAFFSRLCRELAARGHRAKALVWMAAGCETGPRPAFEFACWPSRRPTHLADARFYWDQLKATRPDGVVANFASVNWMTLLAWLRGVPVRAIHYHTLSSQLALDTPNGRVRSAWLHRRKGLVYRLATHLVANSAAAARDAAGLYPLARARCWVRDKKVTKI